MNQGKPQNPPTSSLVGIQPYQPPMPPGPAPARPAVPTGWYGGADIEVFEKVQAFTTDNASKVLVLNVTKKRWRGCDVFVSGGQGIQGYVFITVRAISGANRPIIASGVYFPQLDSIDCKWVAAARTNSTQFQVEIRCEEAPAPSANPPAVTVTMVATDECTTVPPGLGTAMQGHPVFGPPNPVLGPGGVFTPVGALTPSFAKDCRMHSLAAWSTTSVPLIVKDSVDGVGPARSFSFQVPADGTLLIPHDFWDGFRFLNGIWVAADAGTTWNAVAG